MASSLLVTVDNGVAAREALLRAEALQVDVVVTDHHTLPEQLPPLLALLHPACTPERSPYRGLAGVGLAYVLAIALARNCRSEQGLAMARDLFCIGTIADMAPLQGVNRRWLMDGLPALKRSGLVGLQALQQVAGIDDAPVDATAVGFQIAPRINAVGRLGDPQLVVDLLTTNDREEALELARQCEQLNRQRRDLCDAIEAEARALVEADGEQRSPFLLARPEPLAPRRDRHRGRTPGGSFRPASGACWLPREKGVCGPRCGLRGGLPWIQPCRPAVTCWSAMAATPPPEASPCEQSSSRRLHERLNRARPQLARGAGGAEAGGT